MSTSQPSSLLPALLANIDEEQPLSCSEAARLGIEERDTVVGIDGYLLDTKQWLLAHEARR